MVKCGSQFRFQVQGCYLNCSAFVYRDSTNWPKPKLDMPQYQVFFICLTIYNCISHACTNCPKPKLRHATLLSFLPFDLQSIQSGYICKSYIQQIYGTIPGNFLTRFFFQPVVCMDMELYGIGKYQRDGNDPDQGQWRVTGHADSNMFTPKKQDQG